MVKAAKNGPQIDAKTEKIMIQNFIKKPQWRQCVDPSWQTAVRHVKYAKNNSNIIILLQLIFILLGSG